MYRVPVTVEKAKFLKELWKSTFPEASMFLDYVSNACRGGPATLVLPRSGLVRGGLRYTQYANTLFQAPGASIAKWAGWKIAERCFVDRRSAMFGSRIVIFGHDEFVLESREDVAPEAGEDLSQTMVSAAREWLPGVKIEAPPQLHRFYSKDADTVREPGGRLKIWEPKAA